MAPAGSGPATRAWPGQLLATAANDGQLGLWGAADLSAVATITAHAGFVLSAQVPLTAQSSSGIPTQPTSPDLPETSAFSFDRRRIAVVQAAAKELPRMAAEVEVVMVARVVRLDRVGQGPGTATLRGSVERQPGQVVDATVTATLTPHLYDLAVVAHRQQRRIRVVGRLRGNDLYWVRSIQIVGDS